jgi:hypothetical protein
VAGVKAHRKIKKIRKRSGVHRKFREKEKFFLIF